MKNYEIMYIIRPTVEEGPRKELVKEVNEIFTAFDSKVASTEELGVKELAYEIDKHKTGFYVLLKVEATNDAVNEFNRKVKINENIIRYIVVND